MVCNILKYFEIFEIFFYSRKFQIVTYTRYSTCSMKHITAFSLINRFLVTKITSHISMSFKYCLRFKVGYKTAKSHRAWMAARIHPTRSNNSKTTTKPGNILKWAHFDSRRLKRWIYEKETYYEKPKDEFEIRGANYWAPKLHLVLNAEDQAWCVSIYTWWTGGDWL